MPFTSLGEVVSGFHVVGYPQIPVYYLKTPQPVLFDAGVTVFTPAYVSQLAQLANGQPPRMLFITHSHFDHVGAMGGLRQVYPDLKMGGAAKTAQVLTRPNAVSLITKLNQESGQRMFERQLDPKLLSQEEFRPVPVEMVLGEGDRVDLGGGMEMEVLATPGHTWDCLSYWLPKAGIVVAGEAAGCQQVPGNIVTEFLVDYQAYEDAILRLAALKAQVFCQGHHFVYVGDEVDDFLSRSLAEARRFRGEVLNLLQEFHGDQEKVVQRIKVQEWDPCPEPKQILNAYLLNLRARVRVLAENPGRGA